MKRFVSPIASGGGQVNKPNRCLEKNLDFLSFLTFYLAQKILRRTSVSSFLAFVLLPTPSASSHQLLSTVLQQLVRTCRLLLLTLKSLNFKFNVQIFGVLGFWGFGVLGDFFYV